MPLSVKHTNSTFKLWYYSQSPSRRKNNIDNVFKTLRRAGRQDRIRECVMQLGTCRVQLTRLPPPPPRHNRSVSTDSGLEDWDVIDECTSDSGDFESAEKGLQEALRLSEPDGLEKEIELSTRSGKENQDVPDTTEVREQDMPESYVSREQNDSEIIGLKVQDEQQRKKQEVAKLCEFARITTRPSDQRQDVPGNELHYKSSALEMQMNDAECKMQKTFINTEKDIPKIELQETLNSTESQMLDRKLKETLGSIGQDAPQQMLHDTLRFIAQNVSKNHLQETEMSEKCYEKKCRPLKQDKIGDGLQENIRPIIHDVQTKNIQGTLVPTVQDKKLKKSHPTIEENRLMHSWWTKYMSMSTVSNATRYSPPLNNSQIPNLACEEMEHYDMKSHTSTCHINRCKYIIQQTSDDSESDLEEQCELQSITCKSLLTTHTISAVQQNPSAEISKFTTKNQSLSFVKTNSQDDQHMTAIPQETSITIPIIVSKKQLQISKQFNECHSKIFEENINRDKCLQFPSQAPVLIVNCNASSSMISEKSVTSERYDKPISSAMLSDPNSNDSSLHISDKIINSDKYTSTIQHDCSPARVIEPKDSCSQILENTVTSCTFAKTPSSTLIVNMKSKDTSVMYTKLPTVAPIVNVKCKESSLPILEDTSGIYTKPSSPAPVMNVNPKDSSLPISEDTSGIYTKPPALAPIVNVKCKESSLPILEDTSGTYTKPSSPAPVMNVTSKKPSLQISEDTSGIYTKPSSPAPVMNVNSKDSSLPISEDTSGPYTKPPSLARIVNVKIKEPSLPISEDTSGIYIKPSSSQPVMNVHFKESSLQISEDTSGIYTKPSSPAPVMNVNPKDSSLPISEDTSGIYTKPPALAPIVNVKCKESSLPISEDTSGTYTKPSLPAPVMNVTSMKPSLQISEDTSGIYTKPSSPAPVMNVKSKDSSLPISEDTSGIYTKPSSPAPIVNVKSKEPSLQMSEDTSSICTNPPSLAPIVNVKCKESSLPISEDTSGIHTKPSSPAPVMNVKSKDSSLPISEDTSGIYTKPPALAPIVIVKSKDPCLQISEDRSDIYTKTSSPGPVANAKCKEPSLQMSEDTSGIYTKPSSLAPIVNVKSKESSLQISEDSFSSEKRAKPYSPTIFYSAKSKDSSYESKDNISQSPDAGMERVKSLESVSGTCPFSMPDEITSIQQRNQKITEHVQEEPIVITDNTISEISRISTQVKLITSDESNNFPSSILGTLSASRYVPQVALPILHKSKSDVISTKRFVDETIPGDPVTCNYIEYDESIEISFETLHNKSDILSSVSNLPDDNIISPDTSDSNIVSLEHKVKNGEMLLYKDLELSTSEEESDDDRYTRPRIYNGFGDPLILSDSTLSLSNGGQTNSLSNYNFSMKLKNEKTSFNHEDYKNYVPSTTKSPVNNCREEASEENRIVIPCHSTASKQQSGLFSLSKNNPNNQQMNSAINTFSVQDNSSKSKNMFVYNSFSSKPAENLLKTKSTLGNSSISQIKEQENKTIQQINKPNRKRHTKRKNNSPSKNNTSTKNSKKVSSVKSKHAHRTKSVSKENYNYRDMSNVEPNNKKTNSYSPDFEMLKKYTKTLEIKKLTNTIDQDSISLYKPSNIRRRLTSEMENMYSISSKSISESLTSSSNTTSNLKLVNKNELAPLKRSNSVPSGVRSNTTSSSDNTTVLDSILQVMDASPYPNKISPISNKYNGTISTGPLLHRPNENKSPNTVLKPQKRDRNEHAQLDINENISILHKTKPVPNMYDKTRKRIKPSTQSGDSFSNVSNLVGPSLNIHSQVDKKMLKTKPEWILQKIDGIEEEIQSEHNIETRNDSGGLLSLPSMPLLSEESETDNLLKKNCTKSNNENQSKIHLQAKSKTKSPIINHSPACTPIKPKIMISINRDIICNKLLNTCLFSSRVKNISEKSTTDDKLCNAKATEKINKQANIQLESKHASDIKRTIITCNKGPTTAKQSLTRRSSVQTNNESASEKHSLTRRSSVQTNNESASEKQSLIRRSSVQTNNEPTSEKQSLTRSSVQTNNEPTCAKQSLTRSSVQTNNEPTCAKQSLTRTSVQTNNEPASTKQSLTRSSALNKDHHTKEVNCFYLKDNAMQKRTREDTSRNTTITASKRRQSSDKVKPITTNQPAKVNSPFDCTLIANDNNDSQTNINIINVPENDEYLRSISQSNIKRHTQIIPKDNYPGIVTLLLDTTTSTIKQHKVPCVSPQNKNLHAEKGISEVPTPPKQRCIRVVSSESLLGAPTHVNHNASSTWYVVPDQPNKQFTKKDDNNDQPYLFSTVLKTLLINGKNDYLKLVDIIDCIGLDYDLRTSIIASVKKLPSEDIIEVEVKRAHKEFENRLNERGKYFRKTCNDLLHYLIDKNMESKVLIAIYISLSEKIICNCKTNTEMKDELLKILKQWLCFDSSKEVFQQSEDNFLKECESLRKCFDFNVFPDSPYIPDAVITTDELSNFSFNEPTPMSVTQDETVNCIGDNTVSLSSEQQSITQDTNNTNNSQVTPETSNSNNSAIINKDYGQYENSLRNSKKLAQFKLSEHIEDVSVLSQPSTVASQQFNLPDKQQSISVTNLSNTDTGSPVQQDYQSTNNSTALPQSKQILNDSNLQGMISNSNEISRLISAVPGYGRTNYQGQQNYSINNQRTLVDSVNRQPNSHVMRQVVNPGKRILPVINGTCESSNHNQVLNILVDTQPHNNQFTNKADSTVQQHNESIQFRNQVANQVRLLSITNQGQNNVQASYKTISPLPLQGYILSTNGTNNCQYTYNNANTTTQSQNVNEISRRTFNQYKGQSNLYSINQGQMTALVNQHSISSSIKMPLVSYSNNPTFQNQQAGNCFVIYGVNPQVSATSMQGCKPQTKQSYIDSSVRSSIPVEQIPRNPQFLPYRSDQLQSINQQINSNVSNVLCSQRNQNMNLPERWGYVQPQKQHSATVQQVSNKLSCNSNNRGNTAITNEVNTNNFNIKQLISQAQLNLPNHLTPSQSGHGWNLLESVPSIQSNHNEVIHHISNHLVEGPSQFQGRAQMQQLNKFPSRRDSNELLGELGVNNIPDEDLARLERLISNDEIMSLVEGSKSNECNMTSSSRVRLVDMAQTHLMETQQYSAGSSKTNTTDVTGATNNTNYSQLLNTVVSNGKHNLLDQKEMSIKEYLQNIEKLKIILSTDKLQALEISNVKLTTEHFFDFVSLFQDQIKMEGLPHGIDTVYTGNLMTTDGRVFSRAELAALSKEVLKLAIGRTEVDSMTVALRNTSDNTTSPLQDNTVEQLKRNVLGIDVGLESLHLLQSLSRLGVESASRGLEELGQMLTRRLISKTQLQNKIVSFQE